VQNKLSIEDLDLAGERVLVRVDFNVPLTDKKVRDDTRIKAALPTIKYLTAHGAKVILASHLGRPGGKHCEDLKMDPVAKSLSKLLEKPVEKLDSITGDEVIQAVKKMKEGDILLLENLRFVNGEEENDPHFAQQLAELADLYVNDAFGTAHRAHASTVGVASHIPAVAGLLMKKEIEILSACLDNPKRPMTVILGGAKVSDKINVIKRFLSLADNLLIGGGMANTFLVASGYDMGSSFYEENQVDTARELIAAAGKSNCTIYLPQDLVVTEELKAGSIVETVSLQNLEKRWKAADIGPETARIFGSVIAQSALVVWNGPLGVFEIAPFNAGTEAVAKAIAAAQAYSVIGGGDLVAALESLNLSGKMSFISTGGGATLEFWEGSILPGIAALKDRP